MVDVFKQITKLAEARNAANLSDAAAKVMAEHCDERIERVRVALKTIAEWPITDPGNIDAVNMAIVARVALGRL